MILNSVIPGHILPILQSNSNFTALHSFLSNYENTIDLSLCLHLVFFSLYSKKGVCCSFRWNRNTVGRFGKTDYRNDATGFAKTGFMWDITAGYTLFKRLGVIVMYRSQQQPFDNEAYGSERTWFDTEVKATSEPWKLRSGLAGMYFSQPISKRFSIEPKVLRGITYSKPAAIHEICYAWDRKTYYPEISGPSTRSFSILVGLNFKYNLSERFYLQASVDYMKSKSNYKE